MISPHAELVTIIRPCKDCRLKLKTTGCDVRGVWVDYLAGVTRDTTPAPISIKLATGYESARGTAPSEMYQLSPHVSNDVARIGLEDSPTLLNCTRIPFIRREQEDQIIG